MYLKSKTEFPVTIITKNIYKKQITFIHISLFTCIKELLRFQSQH